MKIRTGIGFKLIFAASITLILAVGCKQKPLSFNNYKSEIDSIAIVYVPDLRTGIFDAEIISAGSALVLRGETSLPEAKQALTGMLTKEGVNFVDSLKVLPDISEIPEPWGLVNVSVCNIRFISSYDAEMVSQALMGTPVKILKKENGWLLIQTPDLYLGWVDSDAIAALSVIDHDIWKSSSRLFYTGKTGDIYTDRSMGKVVSDIVAGCILEVTGTQKNGFEVKLPDGRTGYIPAEKAILLDQLSVKTFLNPANLLSTAESFMGIPYLWGGTSSKGFDCSGFVKTIYFLNGIILERDASQQFQIGMRLRRGSFPDSLKKGDLLFFGSARRGRARATHVGMYIGDTEFIHCSGMVRINSLDSTRVNFSRSRRDSFLGVRRIIGAPFGKGIRPVLDHDWYN
ncbi:MAG TPA: glycoside hydrolase [Bacteroidales bacterium]|nr:glycoside hydrolase [Bacteroidales bacterium]